MEFVPKDLQHKGPNPKNMVVEVAQCTGKCFYGYKLGQKWETKGLATIPNFCGAAFHTMFPALFALNFGGQVLVYEGPGLH